MNEELEQAIRKAYKAGEIGLAKRLIAESKKPESRPFQDMQSSGGFMMGYSDPAAGAAQLASRVAPDSRTPEMVLQGMPRTSETIDNAVRSREAAYNAPEGFDWSRMGGNIANPVSAALLGASAGTVPARMAYGAAGAGGYGASMPVAEGDYGKTKRDQVISSMLIGGAIPLGTAIGGKGLELTDQLTRPLASRRALDKFMGTKVSPIQRDVIDHIKNTVGSGKDRVVQALRNTKLYPHNRNITTAQALGQSNLDDTVRHGGSLVGLEGELSRMTEGGLSDRINTVYKGQRVGRKNVLNRLSGTDNQLQQLKKVREAAVNPYYKIVDESEAIVDVAPVVSQIDELLRLNKNRDKITRPLRQLRKKLVRGDDLETNPASIRSVSDDVSDKISAKTPGGSPEFDVKTLTNIKKSLDKQLTDAVPEYGIGQGIYASHSAPINQMMVSRELMKKIDAADVGEESSKPFLRFANDEAKVIRAATGFKRGKSLKDVFEGNEKGYKELMNVIEDMDSGIETSKMAKEVGSVFGGIKTGIELEAPRLLEREIVLTNYLLKKISKDKSGEFAEVAWGLIEDPKYMAEMLSLPGGYPTARAIGERLRQALTAGAVGTESRGVQ